MDDENEEVEEENDEDDNDDHGRVNFNALYRAAKRRGQVKRNEIMNRLP